jgi:hypothetical protein
MISAKPTLCRSAILLAVVTCAFPAWAGPFAEPIARAARGQVQCYAPDPAAKTCSAMATFKPDGNGKVIANAVIMISPTPLIIMTGSATAQTKGGRLCGVLTEKNIEDATFSNADGPLQPSETSLLRKVIEGALQNVFGHELCGAYRPEGAMLKATPLLDGAPLSTPGLRMTWVNPASGYKTAP